MQREYLFRGKRRDNGKWVFGLIGYDSGGGYGRISGWMGDDGGEKFNEVEVISETVCQYTGFKIKNKHLFDGDIVRNEIINDDEDRSEYLICVFIKEWGMFSLIMDYEYESYLESGVEGLDESSFWTFPISEKENEKRSICGNIYEHPHLLNPAGGTASSINMQHDPKEQTEPAQEAAEQATETTTANSEAGEATDTEAGGE